MWGTVHSNVAMEHAPFTVDFSQLATSIQFGDFTACEVWLPESNAADPTRNHLSRGYENQIHLVVYCWVYKTSGPIVVPLGYLTVCYGTSASFVNIILGGGLEHLLFFHILGPLIPFDFHIFQRGRSTTNQIPSGNLLHSYWTWPIYSWFTY